MKARAVAVGGALLALLASAHRHALTAEVAFYCLSLRKNCADACAGNEDNAYQLILCFQLVFAAVLSAQYNLQALTALGVQVHENR